MLAPVDLSAALNDQTSAVDENFPVGSRSCRVSTSAAQLQLSQYSHAALSRYIHGMRICSFAQRCFRGMGLTHDAKSLSFAWHRQAVAQQGRLEKRHRMRAAPYE